MNKVRLTKRFTFEMAHALLNYDGVCKNIHGHSYKLEVCVIGTPINKPTHAEDGLLIDFKALKQMVKINFRLERYNEMMLRDKELLTYVKSAVTKNYSEKIQTLHPDPEKQGVNIDKAKYEAVRFAILENLQTQGELSFKELMIS